jgi:hypothetical protein
MQLKNILKGEPVALVKKGFWIAIGATCGLVVLGLGVTTVSVIAAFSSKNIGAVNSLIVDSWDNITLSKEQKSFKSCYNKKVIEYENYWLWKGREKYIPYYISSLCEKEGFKITGRFLKQYQSIKRDICKEMGECDL